MTPLDREQAAAAQPLLKRPWFWLAALVAVYTLAGAVVVPIVAKGWITDLVRERTGRKLEIGSLRLNPFTFAVTVRDVVLFEATADTFVTVGMAYVNVSILPLLDRRIELSRVAIEDPTIAIRMRADSSFNFDDLLRSEAEPDTGDEPMDVLMERFTVVGATISLCDETVEPDANFSVVEGDVTLTDFHFGSSDTARFTLSCGFGGGGTVNAEGVHVPATGFVRTSVGVDELNLVPVQPYLSRYAHLEITSGGLSLDGIAQRSAAEAGTPELSFVGDVSVGEFNLLDRLKNQRFLGWDRLSVNALQAQVQPLSIRAEEVSIENVYLRLEIAADQSLNAKDVLEPALAQPAEPGSDRLGTPDIYVGRIVLVSGEAYFADYSLPLPFGTSIHTLSGTITEIVPNNPTGASVTARGAIDDHGLAKVDGGLDPFAPMAYTELNVVLTNIEMTRLTPYSGKFAGYKIAGGKMSLDLEYVIRNSQLQGNNELLLEKLTLGEEIESEDATSLPVKLAIALLKDAEGNIDLNMEVSGDLNDPQVNTASLIWQAFTKVLLTIVSAPFRFLGSLLGISGDELEYIQFEPAKADLTPPQLERLANLAKAMKERPSLRLDIHGTVDRVIDVRAIRSRKLDAALQGVMSQRAGTSGDSLLPSVAATLLRESLEELYVRQFSAAELQQQKVMHTSEATDTSLRALDVRAYLKAVRSALVERQPVADEELSALAGARAQAIRSHLSSAEGLSEARVTIAESEELSDQDEEWVRCRLSLDVLEDVASALPAAKDSVSAGR